MCQNSRLIFRSTDFSSDPLANRSWQCPPSLLVESLPRYGPSDCACARRDAPLPSCQHAIARRSWGHILTQSAQSYRCYNQTVKCSTGRSRVFNIASLCQLRARFAGERRQFFRITERVRNAIAGPRLCLHFLPAAIVDLIKGCARTEVFQRASPKISCPKQAGLLSDLSH